MNCEKLSTPSRSSECVCRYTSSAAARFWNQVPLAESAFPKKYGPNVRRRISASAAAGPTEELTARLSSGPLPPLRYLAASRCSFPVVDSTRMTKCPQCGEENPDRAKFCLNCAAPLRPEAAPSREARKTVTVLFCDVTGSTALGEQLDPERLRGRCSP